MNSIDIHVGSRIRERRIALGLTQDQLATLLGVTYQQAHKYERAINRVAASRLFDIAAALKVPVSYFFEGLGEEAPSSEGERLVLENARAFSRIKNPRAQAAISALTRSLAEAA